MKPIDYRNATWEEVSAHIASHRASVYNAMIKAGPATTRHLAAAMRWDILNVRPRVTELVQLGFAECVEIPGGSNKEGTYRALQWMDARRLFETRQTSAQATQLALL